MRSHPIRAAGVTLALTLTFAALSPQAWADYIFTPLVPPGTGPGGVSAFGINNAGVVVGNYVDSSGVLQGFVYSAGAYTEMTIPNSTFTELVGINNSGTAVGDYYDQAGIDHAFLRGASGAITYLPDAPGTPTNTDPDGINNLGTIVGLTSADNFATALGFIYNPNGGYTTFSVLGSTYTVPWAITDSGVIAGWFVDAAGNPHGFIRDPQGNVTQFDVPGSADFTTIYGLNNSGQITGSYADANGLHGFIDSGGVFTTLDYPGASDTEAFSINSQGVVTGGANDFTVGFLAIPVPVPEPSSFALLVLGGVALAGYRRFLNQAARNVAMPGVGSSAPRGGFATRALPTHTATSICLK